MCPVLRLVKESTLSRANLLRETWNMWFEEAYNHYFLLSSSISFAKLGEDNSFPTAKWELLNSYLQEAHVRTTSRRRCGYIAMWIETWRYFTPRASSPQRALRGTVPARCIAPCTTKRYAKSATGDTNDAAASPSRYRSSSARSSSIAANASATGNAICSPAPASNRRS